MFRGANQEALISQVVGRAAETLTLGEIGRDVLPLFERLMGASTSLLYKFQENHPLTPIAGGITRGLSEYASRFVGKDPLQDFMQRENLLIFVGSQCQEWSAFRGNLALADFSDRSQIHWFFHMRLAETGHMKPGFVAMVCGRAKGRPDFGRTEIRAATATLSGLSAAVRRAGRAEATLALSEILEGLLDRTQTRAVLALDFRGNLLWISTRAAQLLSSYLGGNRRLPEPLIFAARRLGVVARGQGHSLTGPPPYAVVIHQSSGPLLEAELYLARTPSGDPFVVADLGGNDLPPGMADFARHYCLTRTETEILCDLSRGLADNEIAGQRFISIPTVRT